MKAEWRRTKACVTFSSEYSTPRADLLPVTMRE